MIELREIHKSYSIKSMDKKVQVLKGLNLTINDGEFLCIKGKSGSGKSTLLNILACLDNADSGEYIFDGEHIESFGSYKLDLYRKNNFGFVFQNYELISEYTVSENIEMPLIARRLKKRQRNQIIKESLQRFDIEDISEKFPSQISGGEQQRTAIARACAFNPRYLVADEPTGALDSINSEIIMKYFKELNEQGRTIIVVTHDSDVADFGSRIVNMVDGVITE